MTHFKHLRYLPAIFLILIASPLILSQTAPANRHASKSSHLLRQDGGPPLFKTWLSQDVVWIISAEERTAFTKLTNDEERDQFVEAFWSRRDPTPDTEENEFKEEHYRRIVYANDHFVGKDPGWKTDRGRIYILYGPPDKVDTCAVEQCSPQSYGRQDYSKFSTESWRYHYLQGVGMEVVIDFVDGCNCGDYQMKLPDELRDAVLAPARLSRRRGIPVESGDFRPFLISSSRPISKFHDLLTLLDSPAQPTGLSFRVTSKIIKATDVTSILSITVSISNSVANSAAEIKHPPIVNLVGRLRTLTGRVAEQFENSVDQDLSNPSQFIFHKDLALFDTRYRMEIAAQDSVDGHVGTWIGLVTVE